MQSDTSVKVAVRIRPLNSQEVSNDDTLCIGVVDGGNQVVAGTDLFFTFDHVFGVNTSQNIIFDSCVTDLLQSAFEGFNATIIAYGQTGSGKTFTMGSSADMRTTSDNMGIIPRVIQSLFDTILEKEANDPRSSYKVHVQFLEIYGEDIRDLLDKTRTSKVTIRETANGEVFVSGAREEIVSSTTQMMKTLEEGTKHRTTASTSMNNESSRSHAIFTVILEHTLQAAVCMEDDSNLLHDGDNDEEDSSLSHGRTSIGGITHTTAAAEVRRSKFHFVDLAGSERIKRTKAQGVQLKEGIDINKGLLALGNVISALGDETKRGKVHVPYRDSKLTRILQDSLGGNSKTLFICCVSPAILNFNESINALKYANRARNIKNKPVVNRDPTLVMIDEFKELVQRLATELLVYKQHPQLSADSIPDTNTLFTIESLEELTQLNKENKLSISKYASKSTASTATTNASGSTTSPYHSSTSLTSDYTRNNKLSSNNLKVSKELEDVKRKLADSEFEIRRLTEQVKTLRMESSELKERVLLTESERDYYSIKWTHAITPIESNIVTTAAATAAIVSTNSASLTEEDEVSRMRSKSHMEEVIVHNRSIETTTPTTTTTTTTIVPTVTYDENGTWTDTGDDTQQFMTSANSTPTRIPLVTEEIQDNILSEVINSFNSTSNKSSITQSPKVVTTNQVTSLRMLEKEKQDFIQLLYKYRKENEDLKTQVSSYQDTKKTQNGMPRSHSMIALNNGFTSLDEDNVHENVENELTTSVARVIAQTKEQLCQEAKKLQQVAEEYGVSHDTNIQALISQCKQNLNISEGQDLDISVVRKAMVSDDDDDDDEEVTNEGENDDSHRENLLNNDESKKKKQRDTEQLIDQETTEHEESYQMRQKVLSNQLQELGESILLKENLVTQLKKSQEQYNLMKLFYENKLTILQKEVDEKQQEREQLMHALSELEQTQNQTAVQKDHEKKLKDELRKKDDELRNLKRKQEELSNLSQIQSRYILQIKKMETDIDTMKKQKVDLTKMVQNEKKKHLQLLHEKVKEVDRLKRELQKTTGEIKRLNMEKARAEDRAREAMREGAMLRKRKNELYRGNDSVSSLSGNNYSSSSSSTAARVSNKSVVKFTSQIKSGNNATTGTGTNTSQNTATATTSRFLSQDELKTKKWLTATINHILDKEATMESMKRLYEQQAVLESQKQELLTQQQQAADIEDVTEREDTKQEIQEKIHVIDQQLKLKNSSLIRLQQQLDHNDDTEVIYEKAIDHMKRNISIQLLRLIFEMLVKSQQNLSVYKDLVNKFQVKNKTLKQDYDSQEIRMTSLLRQHENELMSIRNEYEVKLHGLFEHSSISRMIQAESALLDPSTLSTHEIELLHKDMTSASPESYKMVIALLTTQNEEYKQQLLDTAQTNTQLKVTIDELHEAIKNCQNQIEESECTIQFLESERQVFRDMVNDLKNGILTFGGSAGQLIINQIRENAIEKEKETALKQTHSIITSSSSSGGSSSSTSMTSMTTLKSFKIQDRIQHDNDIKPVPYNTNTNSSSNISSNYTTEDINNSNNTTQPDDDSESVIAEFNDLADEINRTGGIGFNLMSGNKGKGVVYDRLTNPLNFTGSMKNVFEKDVAVKRQKVQKIKNQIQHVPKPNEGNETVQGMMRKPGSRLGSISETTSTDPRDNNILRSSSESLYNLPPPPPSTMTSSSSYSNINMIKNAFTELENDGAKENDTNYENAYIANMTDNYEVRKSVDSDTSDPYSLENNLTGDDVSSALSHTSRPTSPSHGGKKKSVNAISVSDRLHSVTTQSVRLKMNSTMGNAITAVSISTTTTNTNTTTTATGSSSAARSNNSA